MLDDARCARRRRSTSLDRGPVDRSRRSSPRAWTGCRRRRARSRGGRGRGLECAGAGVAAMLGREVEARPARARADRPRPAGRARRRRATASASAHPRRRVRRDVQGGASDAPRALRRLARGAPRAAAVAPTSSRHHLERVVVLRRELGTGDAALAGVASRAYGAPVRAPAPGRCGGGGIRARLLERAVALAPQAGRAAALVYLGRALEQEGELLRAAAVAREATALATDAGDRRTAARARLLELGVTMGHTDTVIAHGDVRSGAPAAVDELEALETTRASRHGMQLLGYVTMDRYDEAVARPERAARHAERAGDHQTRAWAIRTLWAAGALRSPACFEAIARCRALRAQAQGAVSAAPLLRFEAVLLAMRGDIDAARTCDHEADRIAEDRGNRSDQAAPGLHARLARSSCRGTRARRALGARRGRGVRGDA